MKREITHETKAERIELNSTVFAVVNSEMILYAGMT
jgi:hypothetical protein